MKCTLFTSAISVLLRGGKKRIGRGREREAVGGKERDREERKRKGEEKRGIGRVREGGIEGTGREVKIGRGG